MEGMAAAAIVASPIPRESVQIEIDTQFEIEIGIEIDPMNPEISARPHLPSVS
jgi:hypothetical protein